MRYEFQSHVPRLPRGGWHFPDDDGHTVTADSFDQLKTKLAMHRAKNGRMLGDPEQEILGYYSDVAPYLVKIRDSRIANEPGLRQRTAEAMFTLWQARLGLLDNPVEIQTRLDVCRACQACVLDFPEPTDAYWHEADMRGAVFAGSINYLSDGICSHHSLPVNILTALKEPAKAAVSGAPSQCWINKPE